MYRYTIILKVTSIIEGIEFTAYPVVIRTTHTKDRGVVESAAVNRFIRENRGSLTDVKVCRTSIKLIEKVA